MKILKTNWFIKHTLTVFSCVLIIVLGIETLTYADPITTTIGENIATNDLSVTGNVTAGTWQGTAIGTQYGGTGQDFNASTGLLKITAGTASMITDSSTNWDTAYTYSQVGHLPLAGGTLTGGLTVDGVTGLVDADIPDTITASNYLPLTGGTLTADLILQEAGDAKLTIYSNTDSPTADSKLLVVQKGTTPSELFSVDEDGDVVVTNDLAITGNVTAGTWQGDLVATEYGGTGADWSAVAQGNLPYFSAEGALSNLAPGTAGQFLKSQGTGADPAWANVTRSATFVVAANDSSTLSQQQADYVCDGTDDQVEIQAAIDALSTSGGSILLLEGTFILDAPNSFYVNNSKYALNVHGDNVELVGSRGTILKLKDGLVINGGVAGGCLATIVIDGDNISIRNIRFDNNRTNITADYNIAIWHGISAAVGTRVDISYNYFENNKRWAIYGDGGGSFWNIHHNMILPYENGIGFHNGPSRSQICNNIIANVSANIGSGIIINSCDHVQVIGNYIRRPNTYGIQLYDDANYSIISNNIIENYYGTPTGIMIQTKGNDASSCNSNMIQNNSLVNIPTGIKLNDSYVKNTTIKNNQFVSVTTPISDSGTDSVIQNNVGYTTESSGTATLANATTSIAVTHGLAITPSAGDITVTPIEAWGAMTEFYIDTYTSTQFTIHADQDPTQDVDFAWKAIAL